MTTMISARQLAKKYGATSVLAGIQLNIEEGDFVALLGANGTGKSTLMRCILGLTAFEGELHVTGLDPRVFGSQVRARIGYMPQSGSLHTDMSVADTMRFYGSFRGIGDRECLALLQAVRLDHVPDRLVGHLSGGMQQRLSFAVARLGSPMLMLLDEPTSNLDAESRTVLTDELKRLHQQGTTIVMTTHVRSEVASLASRALWLEDGGARELPLGVLQRAATDALEVF